MKTLGCDPGLTGAVVLYSEGQPLQARRDFKALADISDAVSALAPEADAAVIEMVSARPGQGVVSMFSFGRSTGAAFGALHCAGFGRSKPLSEVHPIKWQNYYRNLLNIPRPEEFDSREVACRLLPESDHHWFKRKLDHGTADAFLLAFYAVNNQ